MKILHFSDVHIGVENYSVVDPGTGLSTRLQDFLGTFDEVVQSALDAPADLVLFSGDAYKSRDPSQTHQREFAKRIAALTGAGIPVFLLIGNHDLPAAASRATALDIFPTLNVPASTSPTASPPPSSTPTTAPFKSSPFPGFDAAHSSPGKKPGTLRSNRSTGSSRTASPRSFSARSTPSTKPSPPSSPPTSPLTPPSSAPNRP